MRYLVVLAALLVTPIAADADLVDIPRHLAVEMTISVAGTVPLAGGDLVLDDAFVLTGTGDAFIFLPVSPFPVPSSMRDVRLPRLRRRYFGLWRWSSRLRLSDRIHTFAPRLLSLDTPLYNLSSLEIPANTFLFMGIPIETVSFGASSPEARVTVGGENSFLVGTASFSGTGHAAVPEPEATIVLLVLGVTSIAVWRRHGE